MSLIHLSTELRQELKLTPQLLQSMELLQMNSQELLDYLNQVSEENPLVEQTDLSSLHKAYEALRQKVHWINGGLPEDGHGAMPDRGAVAVLRPPSFATSWSAGACPSPCWP